MRLIGGMELPHVIKNVMSRVISNEIGMLYSWEGARQKKPLNRSSSSKLSLVKYIILFYTLYIKTILNMYTLLSQALKCKRVA